MACDTGIGIPKEKHETIFAPFQQADGTTSRKYGGTGLGLTISREIATLLGGQLEVESELGEGSKFTLSLPVSRIVCRDGEDTSEIGSEDIGKENNLIFVPSKTDPPAFDHAVGDDRFTIQKEDLVLLIIEQDPHFASMVQKLARKLGFKTVITESGEVGVALAEKFLPQAITLDLKLADGASWTTLEGLRRSHKTRRIPLKLVSIGLDSQGKTLPGKGAKSPEQLLDEMSKFLNRIRQSLPNNYKGTVKPEPTCELEPALANRIVLLIDDDPRHSFAIESLLSMHYMQILKAENGREGLDLLDKTPGIDCILMDIMMPELDGYDTMRELRKHPQFSKLPIIALTAMVMPGDREKCLDAGASDYTAKPVDTKQLLSLLSEWLSK